LVSHGKAPIAACLENSSSHDSSVVEPAGPDPAVNSREEKLPCESSGAGDRRAAPAALEEGFDLANAVVQSAQDAIICLTLDGMTLSWNAAAERIFGHTAAEVTNRSFSLVVSPEDWPELLRDLIGVAAGTHVPPRAVSCLRKNGSSVAVCIGLSPVRYPSGEVLGAAVIARQADSLARDEHELRDSNKQLSETVRNLEQRNREMNFVQQLSTLLQSCLTATEAHMVLDQSLPKLFPSATGALFEWNTSVNLLEATVKWGQPRPNNAVFSPEECWALRSGRVHRVADPSTPLLCPHLSRLSSANSICAPLVASGETLGVLTVQGGPYELGQPADLQQRLLATRQQLVETLAGHIALALANLRLRESLRAQSIRDPVSGLFNRRYLDETLPREIHRASRDGRNLAIIMCDLDRFKSFNDSYGHAAGDTLLRSFGDLVARIVRAGDIACRYGGDEFVLILLDTSRDTAERRAELLLREFRRIVIQFGDMFLNPGALSLGVSAFPVHGTAAAALLRVADEALYRAKAEGGNRVAMAKPSE
jgi:diguanylate cyclase (GGDEF)-like protein/PAS domain S-box-containing protein